MRAIELNALFFDDSSMSSTAQSATIQNGAIIGHERRWAALARAFAKDQVPETLLISGAAHVGKSTLALRFAQLLLCPNVEEAASDAQSPGMSTHVRGAGAIETLLAPCLSCRVCHQVAIETFPDYRVYQPIISSAGDEKDWILAPGALEGSIIPIKMARLFGDEAMRRPSIGTRKMMVMRQAERMSVEAQNSLLKTFEEPVRGLSIVLLCDNPDELLPTVLSRAWHLPLSLVPDRAIAQWLQAQFASTSARWIEEAVRVAAGRPGIAWREMRRLERHAGSDGDARNANGAKKTATARAANLKSGAGEAGEEAIPRFTQAARLVERIVSSQPVGALGLTEEALRLARVWWEEDQAEETARESKKGDAKVTRSALARFLDELANAYRARWMQSAGNAANGLKKGGARDASPEEAWADGLDLIRKTRHYILRNANSNLALDVMFGRLIAAWQHPAPSPFPMSNATTPQRRVSR